MTPTAAQIAENIATLRQRAGLTQRDICRAVGMADSTLSHKMKGKADWAVRDLEAVARTLHVTVSELVGEVPSREEWQRRLEPTDTPAPVGGGPRFLVAPETHFDRLRASLSPDFGLTPLFVIGTLIRLIAPWLDRFVERNSESAVETATDADDLALPDTPTGLDFELPRLGNRSTRPIRPRSRTTTHRPGVPLASRLARNPHGYADLGPRAATVTRRRHVQHRRTL